MMRVSVNGAWVDMGAGGASPTGDIEWGDILLKPTTLGGFGITDAAPLVHNHDVANEVKVIMSETPPAETAMRVWVDLLTSTIRRWSSDDNDWLGLGSAGSGGSSAPNFLLAPVAAYSDTADTPSIEIYVTPEGEAYVF
jgi:hypothetical protein